jgi:hypothetical protein
LLIGDRAMHAPGHGFVEQWDLGDQWCRWSELPFVFAMWTARADAQLDGLDLALRQARDEGVAHLDEIAASEAAAVGLTREQCLHPRSMNDGTHDDAWCRDTANVDPPELAMQAHAAPLDLELYSGAAFPQAYRGDWFITLHGSWNRDVPTGYKVVHVGMDADGRPQPPVPFFEFAGTGDIGAGWPHRPVGIRETTDGRLLVSSDRSGVIIAIGHAGE